ncbi:enoyl-CoA hydratase/isomerase family protein [Aspergillus fischeri NRRL 181]|uniref:Enoyl-CoA hydratase/isomerase family protein n=1 Tax=Neosartorya fischeri (strain ATCC 1020 / DSM 3700 / CBS 544.65 / FGSC A1164 / JCM 1740 / NRRL 181 / WB 181) TaxID=331117 RepID=A1D7U8_NEOFI|nr:enoyl-CoA hydratase/isomerase family protein [Aspergillus fischeri NRRL 181]EAW21792.1 enoyl-CoA hydratase/isomerase family protein [Aspergillus fischeri NRRL 181]
MTQSILTTIQDGITTITINRPHRRNAVDPPTAKALYNALLAFDADPAQKICILTGAGGTFCAGADLHAVAAAGTGSSPSTLTAQENLQPVPVSSGKDEHVPSLGPMGPTRLHISKPLIAAIAGHAVAGGLELALLADLRIVEEDAVLGVFCRRWGVPLIDGGTVRLQAIVGLGRALDLILTGRGVGGREALGMGLVSRVVARGKGVEEAMVLARELMRFPERCMNVDRGSCYYSAYAAGSMEDALRREFEMGSSVLATESVRGAARFRDGEGRHGRFEKL